ncbi:hypothetical protein [Paraburkholderia unamae]|uniref:Uncharacterized protein n=1 Tax=Paraburkholderia unamae TaxID=219649 RepID=A0ACC6RX94_9BURK
MFDNNIYNDWGFKESPFSKKPLHSNETGDNLLVGRDEDIRKLALKMISSDAAVCLDGPVGAGKTSLANVTIYKGMKNFLVKGVPSPLLLPCARSFQIKPEQSADELKFEVLIEVAQALIDNASKLQYALKIGGSIEVNAWLNSPLINQWREGVASMFANGDGGQVNEGVGFSKSGFEKVLTNWLEKIFPGGQNGGVVCVIDNLELLEKSAEARKKIENLRDTLLNIRGIKWILCGAHGILQGVITSPRLAGYLQEPLPIKPLTLKNAGELFNRRVNFFKIADEVDQYLPLSSRDFHTLYTILQHNLRICLSYAEDYCMHVSMHGLKPQSDAEKSQIFFGWLKERAKGIYEGLRPHAGETAIKLLCMAASSSDMEGEFSPGDHDRLGFSSLQAMRPHVKTLEDCGLLSAQKDDLDQRRKTISITGKGWLIYWYKVTLAQN